MNQYFFKMTNEERTSILDQHKHVYDGYVTNYANQNEQPLYVQDFANDKGGVTLNNKGEITTYKNMGINESILENDHDDSYMVSVGEQLDMIGDGDDDLKNGTTSGHDDEERSGCSHCDSKDGDFESDECPHCNGRGHDEFTGEECEWCDGTGTSDSFSDEDNDWEGNPYDYMDDGGFMDDKPESFDDIDIRVLKLDPEDMTESLQEQVNKTLDMFRRFKNL
jgi:hypothetical protein